MYGVIVDSRQFKRINQMAENIDKLVVRIKKNTGECVHCVCIPMVTVVTASSVCVCALSVALICI